LLKTDLWVIFFALFLLSVFSLNPAIAEPEHEDFEEFIEQLLQEGRQLPEEQMEGNFYLEPGPGVLGPVSDTPHLEQPVDDTPVVDTEKEVRDIASDTEQMYEIIMRLQADMEDLRKTVASLEKEVLQLRAGAPDTSPEKVVVEDTPEIDEVDEEGLNPNKASLEELRDIPPIPDHIAERIRWYREEVGAFSDRSELEMVPGVSSTLYRQIKEYFAVGPYDEN